ncbi:hypothetical protein DKX38_003746 [Salix brachista]|uniref:Reverse transcriptase/retrotransposon-derived protein RNase H-like domain-containing protein n=1 Tax=Salix brachista TaxID=2182728 RepID=A0A5N5N9D2_9ROSI|nr:hypothetical protein DKX38_003746 [Salix brachista]
MSDALISLDVAREDPFLTAAVVSMHVHRVAFSESAGKTQSLLHGKERGSFQSPGKEKKERVVAGEGERVGAAMMVRWLSLLSAAAVGAEGRHCFLAVGATDVAEGDKREGWLLRGLLLLLGSTVVKYLGHVINNDGVSVDPDKIQSVVSWPTPMTTKAIRGFLGLAGYYRKFIQHFGGIAAPMTKLITNEKFQWTEEAEAAFNRLKKALTSLPTLCLPDFSQPFVVECDACGTGIGAVLTQHSHPVAYFSAALKGSSLALSTYEKEMLAIVKAIRRWRHYLLGKPFIQGTCESEENGMDDRQKVTIPDSLGKRHLNTAKKSDEKHGRESLSSQGSDNIHEVGEWKEATQFFELVRTNVPRKVVDLANNDNCFMQNTNITAEVRK